MNLDLIFKSSNQICKFRGVGKGGRTVDICCKNTLLKCMQTKQLKYKVP